MLEHNLRVPLKVVVEMIILIKHKSYEMLLHSFCVNDGGLQKTA
jgi:hypothetical protein